MSKEIFPGWVPLQVAKFYDFPLQITGKGQSVAVVSLGGQIDSKELDDDFARMRIAPPDIRFVDVDPENITDEQNEVFTGETHLDLEVIGSICPDARISVFRGSWKGGFAAAINRAVDESIPVISISWGYPEFDQQDFSKLERALERAREHNITVCASSGDAGSSASITAKGRVGPAKDGKAHVYYPASSPNVLACGGTELSVQNREAKEVVWNNISIDKGATGGGVSVLFDRPSWQSEIDILHASTSATGRIVPDVAGLAAARDWEIFMSGRSRPTGGTSAVAPLWSALFVLVNQLRAEAGKAPIGFVNERLYELAKISSLFKSIDQGSNRIATDYPGYNARDGFDACTGWGTPRAQQLIQALVKL